MIVWETTSKHHKYNLQQHKNTLTTLAGACLDLIFSNLPDLNAYALVNSPNTRSESTHLGTTKGHRMVYEAHIEIKIKMS